MGRALPFVRAPARHSLHLCRNDLPFRRRLVIAGSFEFPRSAWAQELGYGIRSDLIVRICFSTLQPWIPFTFIWSKTFRRSLLNLV